MKNSIVLNIHGKDYTIQSQKQNFEVNGKIHEIDFRKITEDEYSILIDGHSYHAFFTKGNDCSQVQIGHQIIEVKRRSLRDELSAKFLKRQDADHSAVIYRAPMPGMVTKILKPIGASINIGEGVVVVEAMKMENEIKTTKKGTIKKVFVQEKQAVEKGDQLFAIE